MGVYDNLLKKKVIKENEDGSISLNREEMNNVYKPVNDYFTNNTSNMLKIANNGENPSGTWETIKRISKEGSDLAKKQNNNNSNTNNSLWSQITSLAKQSQNINSFGNNNNLQLNTSPNTIDNKLKLSDTPLPLPTTSNGIIKNTTASEDAKSLTNLLGRGISSGLKNVPYFIENANEQLYPNYKDMRKIQYLNSSKVNILDKAKAKMQDNILFNNKNDQDKVETNLIKKYWKDSIEEDEKKIQEEQTKLSNQAMQSLGQVVPSMGQMLPGTVLSAVNPILGTGYFYTSTGGNYIKDGLQRGMTEKQAWQYGNIMATLESASETAITGQQLNKISKAFGGKQISKSVLNSYGFNILENALQEAVMEPAQELTAQLVAGNDKANWDGIWERMGTSAINGGLMGVISNGATLGLENTGKAYNKIKNGQTLTQSEVKSVLQENVDALGKEKVENTFKQGANEVYKQIGPTTIQNNQQNTPNQQTILPTQENALNQNVVKNNQLPTQDNTINLPMQNNIANNQENSLQGKSFEDILDHAMSNYEYNETPSPLKDRNINTIGKETKVNAYQYDNPEVKPYFQEMAQMLGEDVGNIASADNRKTTKGGGTALSTNISGIKQLKEMGYSYNQIIDGIVNIIDDHGKENNALSKKLEIIIDDQLRNGYRNSYGKYISPNQEYINLISKDNTQNNQVLPTDNKGNIKSQQFNIIKETNPMLDDYHTGIRSENDIKTFDEVIDDDESFVYGDFSREDAEKALKDGKVTVYSSKPIEQGNFVSTSKNMAKDYAGNGKVYSKEVNLNDVAWINGDEGQYAKVDNLANNSKKVYNIINKSLTKNEKAQVASEVRKWRINQEDGIGYIDLSNQGYKSYIYNKQGSDVETLLKVNGSEEFRNFIRKGIEDGTFTKTEGFNKSIAEIKDEYRRYRVDNDSLSRGQSNNRDDKLFTRQVRREESNNTTGSIEQNSGNESVGDSKKSSFNLPTKGENIQQEEKANLPTQGEKINWNEVEKPEGKFRKHYQSIIESSNTTAEAKAIAKELMGTDTYVPESNKNLIKKADAKINTTNPNTELSSLYSKVMNNEKVTDVDIAVGERLIEYYSKIGDSEHLLDAIHATSMAGTQAGRTVQAMALLNHMTPQGQVVWMQRSIDKANNELQQKYHNKKDVPQFKLTQEMTDKILNTDSTEEMFNTIDEVYEELGQQVPKSMSEKIDEWRYFSMLANAKTHVRNILGNVAMHYTQRTKDKLAGVIEGTVAKFNPEMERTHTIVPTNKEVKQFAKNDLNNRDVQTQLGMNEDKYNPQSRLQSARRTFKSDLMENTLGKLFDVNSKALEVEDNIGLKAMYVKTLGEYITANKLDINNMTDAQLNKARQHAIKEAKEATFHQASSLATALQQMGNKNNLTKFALDAVVPFKKTPINVAKTGAQYSPIGLIKSAIFDVNKVRKGTMTANQYIDNISKGLTGTGITFLGYALAESGILKASGGDDDKKEKYDEEQGKQSYALEIGGNTYSLDWLSPVGIPLFIGAETNQQFKQTKKEKNTKSSDDENVLSNILQGVANVANGASNAMNPMSEMSMVSGLTSVLSSYNKENAVGDMLVNTGKSYVNQFVPTLLGQVARTTDDYERSTKSTKTGTLEKAVDSTINQIKSKIPGLRQTLPTKTDIWGQDVKQSENLPFRAFNNFINPAKVQDVSTDIVDKELNNLYSKTRESSIIPKSIDKVFSINGTDYRLTNDEYAQYNKTYGKTAHNLLEKLIQTDDYKSLADAQKQKVIENIYSYAKENNKVNYSNKVKENLDTSSLYKTIQDLKNNGGDVSSYLSYKGKVADIQGEDETMQKNIILRDSNYDNKTKSIIYKNNTGKDDKLYSLVPDININQYLEYKIKTSNEEFKADKDSNGKTISGSAKKKLEEYLKQNITGPENRLVILGSKYKLSKTEQQRIVDYISKISKTNEEAVEKLGKLGNNFLLKDGKAYFK